jgi:choline kinase
MITQAIILAAGKGSRLGNVTANLPKCLARIGGMSLIERQIASLWSEGIHDIAAVVGFGAGLVRETCGHSIQYIENRHYDETNSLFSLWLARELMGSGFIVLNADVLFHPQLLRDLITARYEDALLVGYRNRWSAFMGDEEMKVRVRGGTVANITKKMDPRKADGENVGIAKFGAEGAGLLVEKLNRLIRRAAHRDWAPRAFLDFASERPLHVVSTRGFPWIEIDYQEDYWRAVTEVMPMIALDEAPGLKSAGFRSPARQLGIASRGD